VSSRSEVENLVAQGLDNFERSDYEAATAAIDAAIELDPSVARAWCARGMVLHRLGEVAKAEAHYRKAIAINPRYARAHFNIGMLKLESGDSEASLSDFDAALALDQEGRFYFRKGEALSQLNRWEESIDEFKESLKFATTKREFATSHTHRGLAHYQLDNCSEAIVEFQSALDRDPEYLLAIRSLSHALLSFKKYDEAISCIDKVFSLNEATSYDYQCRAAGNYYAKRYDTAVSDYSQAIEADSASSDSYYGRGVAYAQLGRHELAVADFSRGIELNPQDRSSFQQRSKSWRALGEDSKANADLEHAKHIQSRATHEDDGVLATE
jgi:tetratricopeptide (TPR) repeat protein